MSPQEHKNRKPSAAARAEAAAWVARLHGPNRTREVEAGLRRWLADDPAHPLAFDLLTETWERSARLRRRPIEQAETWGLLGFRLSFPRALLATLAIAAIAVASTVYYLHSNVISTGIGELRTLTLGDGTRVYMNSSTRLVVQYTKALRQVRLESGEAFFNVTRNPARPFVVTADARQIRALGTQFDVRAESRTLAVILLEGKITVTPIAQLATSESVPGSGSAAGPGGPPLPSAASQVFTLTPGERLTFAPADLPRIDRPQIEFVMAWERGQIMLDNTSLAAAVAEMNRYSRGAIVIDDPAAASIRVSGVFQAGDSVDFAAAVAKTYHLKETTYPDGKIVLSPRSPPGG